MLENFTVGTFSGRIGETFRIRSGASRALDLSLVSATALGESSERGRPFSILFRGPEDYVLPQGIYRLEHAQIGAFEIFLVPIGPDEAGMRYEAVFN